MAGFKYVHESGDVDVDFEANHNVCGEGGKCVALNAHKHPLHEERGTRRGII